MISLPVSLLLVVMSVREENRRRSDAHFRVVNGLPQVLYQERQLNLPEWVGPIPKIEPPRAPDVTAHVRLVPHPLDYRKFTRVVEGVSDDPFDAYTRLDQKVK